MTARTFPTCACGRVFEATIVSPANHDRAAITQVACPSCRTPYRTMLTLPPRAAAPRVRSSLETCVAAFAELPPC